MTLWPSDQRGKVADGATGATGTDVMTEGADFAQVPAPINEKYGFMVMVVKLVNRLRSVVKRDNMQWSGAMIIALDSPVG